jgi:hypothetical protein
MRATNTSVPEIWNPGSKEFHLCVNSGLKRVISCSEEHLIEIRKSVYSLCLFFLFCFDLLVWL